jgi:PAS domain S-box-containing protein
MTTTFSSRHAPLDAALIAEIERVSRTGSWTVDLDTGDVLWSKQAHHIFGTDPETFEPSLERSLELVHPDDRGRVREYGLAWRRNKDPECFGFVYRCVRPDGGERLIYARGWVELDDDGGDPTRALGIVRDITESVTSARDLELADQQRSHLLRATSEGICGLDPAGRVTFVNAAMEALLGRYSLDIHGTLLHDLVHRDPTGGEDHPAAECPFNGLLDTPMRAVDLRFRRDDGSTVLVEYGVVPVQSRHFPGNVVSVREITESREHSRQARSGLERLRALSEERRRLLRELACAHEQERVRIAADIHDDTAQVLGALCLRLDVAAADSDERCAEVLRDAACQVRDATRRVRSLMFELTPPTVTDDLRQSLETYARALLQRTPTTFAVTGAATGLPEHVSLLAYRLAQEALRNVVKHAQANHIEVTLHCEAEQELAIAVRDNGIGPRPTPHDRDGDGLQHAGLTLVGQRAIAAGGSFTTGPGIGGRGFSVEVRLPLDPGGPP